jgi:hypothetical protein
VTARFIGVDFAAELRAPWAWARIKLRGCCRCADGKKTSGEDQRLHDVYSPKCYVQDRYVRRCAYPSHAAIELDMNNDDAWQDDLAGFANSFKTRAFLLPRWTVSGIHLPNSMPF